MNTALVSLAALVAASVLSPSAHAVVRPGWDRPIARAELTIHHATGAFADVKNAELTRFRTDGVTGAKASGFILTLESRGERAGTQEYRYIITGKQADGCGSVRYTAQPELAPVGVANILEVVDHSRRLCEDYRPFLWDVKVRRGVVYPNAPVSTLEMGGNPEAVITIQ